MAVADDKPKKSKRGFASMGPEKQREIARKGGKSGRAVDPANRSFSRDRGIAVNAGAMGGKVSHSKPKGEERP
jgi:general stress protein YciG